MAPHKGASASAISAVRRDRAVDRLVPASAKSGSVADRPCEKCQFLAGFLHFVFLFPRLFPRIGRLAIWSDPERTLGCLTDFKAT
jgi:hypothetical protein